MPKACLNHLQSTESCVYYLQVSIFSSKKLIFSDIKDFTTITESLKPRQLIDMLQIYFDELSAVIHQNEGTLDKYIGDSIMCFWNAPLMQEDYIFKAVNAALEMDDACKRISQNFVKEGF